MSPRITGPKGAPDLLPPRSALHEQIIERAIEQFRLYGYRRIETPVFESTELFERGLDEGSDVVTKQMYTFQDRKGRSLTLRPDMTAPVVRAILEHRLDKESMPVKLYYAASIFRRERPQAGRQRQFTQVGVEAVGNPGPELDAEVVHLAGRVFKAVGLPVHLAINTVGHHGCRAEYLPILQEYLRAHADQLCPDCRRKIETNPLRTFDCKVESDRKILARAPLMIDHICPECKEHYETVKFLLADWGVPFTEDPKLVRGLDYYTRTAFEFVAAGLGSQDAVGGGGRYDGLSEQLGGPSLPGIGFGLGVERIALALGARGVAPPAGIDVYVVTVSDRGREEAFRVVPWLRSSGISTDLDFGGRNVGAQFKAANKIGARWAVVIGDKELDAGSYTVRNMSSGAEAAVPVAELVSYLKDAK
jgi:histidyl-tRNA synthetase